MLLKQAPKKSTKMDIIPMVDIVFQLIIFFLVATQAKEEETAVDLRLPMARESKDLKAETNPPLLINVIRPEIARRVGNRPYVWGGESMDLKTLTRKLESKKAVDDDKGDKMPAVRIRGDRDSSFEDVRNALAACTDVGIQEVRIATIRKEN